jgi:hypothetical protein
MELVLYELGRLWHAAGGTKEQCVVIGLVWPSSAASVVVADVRTDSILRVLLRF